MTKSEYKTLSNLLLDWRNEIRMGLAESVITKQNCMERLEMVVAKLWNESKEENE